MSDWRNRIVGERDASVRELLVNPWNWRVHSERQRFALGEVLDHVGWVQRVVVNRRTGRIVDGHLRVALARERYGEGATVPVIEVDLSEEEELAVLATLDPVAGLAGVDELALAKLAREASESWPEVDQLLEELNVWAPDQEVTLTADRLERVPVRRWYVLAVPLEAVEQVGPALEALAAELPGAALVWTDEKRPAGDPDEV